MIPPGAVYLGDGVYTWLENGDFVLATSDGVSITNRIVLERDVFTALLRTVLTPAAWTALVQHRFLNTADDGP